MAVESFGFMYLSSVLKEEGHECDVLIENDTEKIVRYLKKGKFDVAAFSPTSFTRKWVFDTAEQIKNETDCVVTVGGSQPTYYPENIDLDSIDYACRGESEEAYKELINRLEKGEDTSNIENIWTKRNGEVIKNPLRNLKENLDELPYPDRDLYYDKYSYLKKWGVRRFITGRGCPFNCSFCFTNLQRKIYKGKGNFVRKRSPQDVIDEIKYVKKNYRTKIVSFFDNILTYDKEWLREFLKKYKEQIELPFVGNTHPSTITFKDIEMLKEAGCRGLYMGIETFNQELRNKILNKDINNHEIKRKVLKMRQEGIKVFFYNMFGIPGENFEDLIKSIKFNIEAKADYANCTILNPLPKTDFTKWCIEEGYLEPDYDEKDLIQSNTSFFRNSKLKINDKEAISNMARLFPLAVQFPRSLGLLIKIAKNARNEKLKNILKIVHEFSANLSQFRFYDMNIFSALKIYLKNRAVS